MKYRKYSCFNCNKILLVNSNWYFFNDKVFCSKACRTNVMSVNRLNVKKN